MAYVGNVATIKLGSLGIMTDLAQSALPPYALQEARNVSLNTGKISTAIGSDKYNASAMTGSVIDITEYTPTPSTYRLMALTTSGKLYKGASGTMTEIATGLGTLTSDRCQMVSGGLEESGSSKKLFVFTGTGNPRVVTADANTTTELGIRTGHAVTFTAATDLVNYTSHPFANGDIVKFNTIVTTTAINTTTYYYVRNKNVNDFQVSTTPTGTIVNIDLDGSANVTEVTIPSDWTVSYPTYGIIHVNRLWAFGNSGSPHTVYVSLPTDHEDFTGTGALTFYIYPGEGEKLAGAIVYKGRLFLFKYPTGVYFINTDDADASNWYVGKLSDTFGISSPHAAIQVLDDLFVGNNTGTITSLAATQAFGDLDAGDVLSLAKCEQYFRDILDFTTPEKQWALYYPEKKQAFFTTKRRGKTVTDSMLVVDVNDKGTPKVDFIDKDAPQSLCLFTDSDNIKKPMYGSTDGFIYKLTNSIYNNAGSAYTSEFKTIETNFSYLDQSLASKNKIFDFIELVYKVSGNWSISLDVYIDGSYSETILFNQAMGATLGTFVLGTDKLGGAAIGQRRKQLHGSGHKINFRIYNNVINQYFVIEEINVGFRVSAEQEKK